MEKLFIIKYEVRGSRRVEEIHIWAKDIFEAIETFETTEFKILNVLTIVYTYNAIKSIEEVER